MGDCTLFLKTLGLDITKLAKILYSGLTFYIQEDGLAGLVLSVLVVDGLGVVPARIWGHGGEDDKGVVQSKGSKKFEREK